MSNPSQRRALQNYRSRLAERGMTRFEVLGLKSDRERIRSVAGRLAKGGADADIIRQKIDRALAGEVAKKGGVLAALRRSPLVGADLSFKRSRAAGRKIDL